MYRTLNGYGFFRKAGDGFHFKHRLCISVRCVEEPLLTIQFLEIFSLTRNRCEVIKKGRHKWGRNNNNVVLELPGWTVMCCDKGI